MSIVLSGPARYRSTGSGRMLLPEDGSLVDVDYPNLLNNFREHLDPKSLSGNITFECIAFAA